jgi:alpha-L-fucosidase
MAKKEPADKKKAKTRKSPVPGPDTAWHVHDRFGMFIHWGIYSLGARHEWIKKHERMTNKEYRKYFDRFDPDLYDPRAWARAARQAGMKYFAITTKHHDGFCLWDSKLTNYKVTNTPYGKDVLAPMLDAFREEGLKACLYHSLLDWHHPEYTIDQMHPLCGHKTEKDLPKRDMAKYREYLHGQVRELMTQFGKIYMVWFDFSFKGIEELGYDDKNAESWGGKELVRMVRELQPGIMINNRLGLEGKPDFVTPEQYQAEFWPVDEKGRKLVWEGCQTFSGSWGYHRDEASWKSTKTLLWLLIDSVSKGGNLLLNVGPNGRGEFDERAMERLEGIGRWMRVNSRSIYGCTEARYTPPPDCRYTYNPKLKRLYLHVMNWPIRNIRLPGLHGKVKYAQFLHDASEIAVTEGKFEQIQTEGMNMEEKTVRLDLPPTQPNVEIPVIEMFLR